jgi:hypothetical protein
MKCRVEKFGAQQAEFAELGPLGFDFTKESR